LKITPTSLPEVFLIEPKVFGDARGYFYESFSQRAFDHATGQHASFIQDNHSLSQQGVLRGLHYQLSPFAQGKLVRVVEGEVFDVAVDIRKGSPRFGKWVGMNLSAENKRQLWIPPGFAHGFFTLSPTAQFAYKTTQYYAPAYERCIRWNDPAIDIAWPLHLSPVLSEKDAQGMDLHQAEVFD
jgi:dTDP-4-dehydrorhamnose 3,5-epimerase